MTRQSRTSTKHFVTRIIWLLPAALWAVLWTHLVSAETLEINVDNVRTSNGTLLLQVMQGEVQFKGEQEPVLSLSEPAKEGTITFVTKDLPPGEYAVRVMHDENDNFKLDANFMGIPKEPWGFSNNAKGRFGPPGWDAVRFTVPDMTVVNITLNK